MKHLKSLFTAILLIVVVVAAQAQIEYSGGTLKINTTSTYPRTSFVINKMDGMHWMYAANGRTNFLHFDLTNSVPHISGFNNIILFYNNDTKMYTNLHIGNIYTHSDARAKTNIKNIGTGLNTLMQLRPVTYTWKQRETTIDTENTETDTEMYQSKNSDAVSYGPENETGLQYGFLAQEVEKVLPSVVATTEEGDKLINYTAIIPLLVQSVQELQATVEAQAATIDRLQATLPAEKLQATGNNKILGCTPNPTSGIMTVSLQLESGVKSASIAVTSLAGNREKTVAVADGAESVELDLSALSSGIHIASLYVNGRLVDSVRIAKE